MKRIKKMENKPEKNKKVSHIEWNKKSLIVLIVVLILIIVVFAIVMILSNNSSGSTGGNCSDDGSHTCPLGLALPFIF